MSITFDEQSAIRIARQTIRGEQSPRSLANLRPPLGQFGTNKWWPCKNQAATDCPAFGIAAVVGQTTITGDDRPFILIDQPSATFREQYVVVGPDGVKAGDTGACTFGPLVEFVYGAGAPTIDDGFGPVAGQWTALKTIPAAITAIGVVDATKKLALGWLTPLNHNFAYGGWFISGFALTAGTFKTDLSTMTGFQQNSTSGMTISGSTFTIAHGGIYRLTLGITLEAVTTLTPVQCAFQTFITRGGSNYWFAENVNPNDNGNLTQQVTVFVDIIDATFVANEQIGVKVDASLSVRNFAGTARLMIQQIG